MDINDLKSICVIGGGLMGRQIALNTAMYGYNTIVTDSKSDVLSDVKNWAEEYLNGRIKKGRIDKNDYKKILDNFHIEPNLKKVAPHCQLIIEAIIEDREIKRELFKEINSIVSNETIIATNSSYMVSSEFKDVIDNPKRLANLHYFNPALVMKLTEVVKGMHTSQETIDFLMEFSKKTGKKPILVRKEIDGFVVNRILRSLKDEAYFLVEEGISTPEEVDLGVELGLNHPMGPFRLNDLTGIDLTYYQFQRRLNDTGVKPPGYDIVKEKFEAKEWGKKTGKGFYNYSIK